MMLILYTILTALIAAELLLNLPFKKTAQAILIIMNKSMSVVRSSRISDQWKERAMQKYSLLMAAKTLQLSFFTFMLLLPVLLFGFLSKDYYAFLQTPSGIILLTCISLAYVYLKKKMPKSDYGLGARLLHQVALGPRFVAEMSFDVEQATHKFDASSRREDQHVFISGLARAGTTLIMRRFYASGQFASLTYEDMPFILMPNQWHKINALSAKKSHKKERIHGDGLLVDYNSPEALEEVFWRTFAGDDYIQDDKLIPIEADGDLIDQFRSYVTAVITRYEKGKRLRYLSKNNNNILRLSTIQKAFPQALIIIPFRDPLQQANSLWKMHQRLIDAQKSDKFICQYMQWIGHYEFGLGHKPFCLGDEALTDKDSGRLNYWLQLWINTYRWLKENAPSSAVFLCFEKFCQDIDHQWPKWAGLAGIPVETEDADIVSFRTHEVKADYDGGLLEQANNIYDSLVKVK